MWTTCDEKNRYNYMYEYSHKNKLQSNYEHYFSYSLVVDG